MIGRSAETLVKQCFSSISEPSVNTLLSIVKKCTFTQGQTIFRQGSAPEYVHLLCLGRIRLSLVSDNGRRFVVKVAESGVVFGLAEVIARTTHKTTTDAVENCETLQFDAEHFLKVAAQHNDITFSVAQHLARECQQFRNTLKSVIAPRTVAARLAGLLLQYAENEKAGSVATGFRLTHGEIAELIGASRESVSRAIQGFRKLNVVELCHTKLRVSDPSRLRKLVAI